MNLVIGNQKQICKFAVFNFGSGNTAPSGKKASSRELLLESYVLAIFFICNSNQVIFVS